MNHSSRMTSGIILIIIGAIFLFGRFHLYDIGWMAARYWPVILLAVGVWMLFGNGERAPEKKHVGVPGVAGQVTTAPTAERLEESMVFGEISAPVRTQAFRGGSASIVFGHCLVDLSAAALAPGEQTLDVESTFGKVEVILPSTIPAKVSAGTLIGSVSVNGERSDGFSPEKEWESPGYASAATRLKITAGTMLGEVLVTSVVR
jgi:predicted membrane protein